MDKDSTFWARADRHLMRTGVPFSPMIITRASGTRLYDSAGKSWLDFTSGQMSSVLGHSHPAIVAVVQREVAHLDHLLSNMVTHSVVELAERLAGLMPAPLTQSFFLSTGSESVEAAIKLAKCYTGRFEVVAFAASYHGMTQGSSASTYCVGRKGAGPAAPGAIAFPAPDAYRSPSRTAEGEYDWRAEMAFGWALVDAQSVGSLAAFVVEPVLSAGGVLVPPEGYMRQLQVECRRRGMLLIVDEAQTGLGRTGDMFAFQHDGVVPDVLALSKTLGCGLPLSSVTTSEEIATGAVRNGFFWLSTHYNDPLAAAVGNKVIEVIERGELCRNARERGEQLREGLLRLKDKYWCIGDVRGRGLLQGVEVICDPVLKTPGGELGTAVANRAMSLGLSCQIVSIPGFGGVFRLAPPLTVTAEEIDEGLAILDQAFQDVLLSDQVDEASAQPHL
ncbi:hypothetical protein ANO11243_093050 [Dothideomycetidae sp. 11243]|nr:hypothetical protein ANO11243_093050 [fungal sp. No.11243]